jgi:hypothetical protein
VIHERVTALGCRKLEAMTRQFCRQIIDSRSK